MEYKSTIKSTPLLYKETKKAAEFINKGYSLDSIKKLSMEDNIFQYDTETRKKEVALKVGERLSYADKFIIDKIINSNIESSKLMVLYIIMKQDKLLYEFMNSVYKEKIILKDAFIRDIDFGVFFQNIKEKSEKAAGWSDYTFKKLQRVILKILFDVGLIENQKGDREIRIPLIDKEIKKHLKEIGDNQYLYALTGMEE